MHYAKGAYRIRVFTITLDAPAGFCAKNRVTGVRTRGPTDNLFFHHSVLRINNGQVSCSFVGRVTHSRGSWRYSAISPVSMTSVSFSGIFPLKSCVQRHGKGASARHGVMFKYDQI